MLKSLLPRSLFARSLLIIVTPVILLQIIAGIVFFQRHLQAVAERLAIGVAGDVAFVRSQLLRTEDEMARARLLAEAAREMRIRFALTPGGELPPSGVELGPVFFEQILLRRLAEALGAPFSVNYRAAGHTYRVVVPFEDGMLSADVPRHRVTSSTAHILMWWVVGSSLLLLAIAILFLRNQIRPIRRLALAAERFGKGQDVAGFKPTGAAEVRLAATAFLRMRGRIQRQIRQRTEMLAGVSHDLRTPLTRLKLQLEMMEETEDIAGMKADVEVMGAMIEEYLAFARGARGETPVETDLADLLGDVVGGARRQGADVALETTGHIVAPLRRQAVKRCLTNLLDNARRHGGKIQVAAERQDDSIVITIDDDGPGIPEDERRKVFRPFHRLEGSRNPETGGVGLGLAIARDAVRSHGGDIVLEKAPLGGLRASVRLPI